VAQFRQVNPDQRNVHHDALELPDGQIVLVTKLAGGQHATVLQLPTSPCEIKPKTEAQSRSGCPTMRKLTDRQDFEAKQARGRCGRPSAEAAQA
jgi:hypothetical protein